MESRLVLGRGAVARAVIEATSTWPGDLHVVAERAETERLSRRSPKVHKADPTDPANYPDRVDAVVVASDVAATNCAAARAARERYADALIIAFTGFDADDEACEALSSVADRVLDPGEAVLDRLRGTVIEETADRVHRLLGILRNLDGPLAIVTHDNPDPDAIASAVALGTIAESVGVEAEACYFGEISHQENRALVNLLNLELRNLSLDDDVSEYAGVALVDHSRPGVNDRLPEDTAIDIVVDHHPPRAPVQARFLDLRSDVGATSTLLAEYLERLGIVPDWTVATALLFGIRVDTKEFTREVSTKDLEAAAFLLPYVDEDVLERTETPSMSAEVLETMARAIRNRDVRGDALASGVGGIRDRDALAQAADRLLNMEGVNVTLVYGFINDTVYVSGRARGSSVDLGETLREALGPIGSAGGHADMAGAQIPLGILADVDAGSQNSLAEIIREVISERFFETLVDARSAPNFDEHQTFGLEFPIEDV